jgi:dihydroxy-acid dehydratase
MRIAAAGIPAILNELTKIPGLLHLDQLTVTGATRRVIKEAAIRDHEVIRSIDTPFAQPADWRCCSAI